MPKFDCKETVCQILRDLHVQIFVAGERNRERKKKEKRKKKNEKAKCSCSRKVIKKNKINVDIREFLTHHDTC